tara:strand:- start:719 stop:859 length:141 start_codon:yes stop_codon:yes gene_type:complete
MDNKEKPFARIKKFKLPVTKQEVKDTVIIGILTITAVYLQMWWVFK